MQTNGRTVLITGTTSGIGFVTARELARQGYRVFLGARDAEKGKQALDTIQNATGNPDLHLALADLTNMRDVRRLAEDVRSHTRTLDLLIHNAGGIMLRRQTTVDGFEYTLALNHLAPFLLTQLLLPTLRATDNARVVSVSSNVHRLGRIHWDDLDLKHNYQGFAAYSQSKLMTLLFAFALAKRLEGTSILSNAVHPGVVASHFWDHGTSVTRPVFGMIKRFVAIPPEAGAKPLLYAATSPRMATTSGAYIVKDHVLRAKASAYDIQAQDRLWEWSRQRVAAWL